VIWYDSCCATGNEKVANDFVVSGFAVNEYGGHVVSDFVVNGFAVYDYGNGHDDHHCCCLPPCHQPV
jgi:hypothetical protein